MKFVLFSHLVLGLCGAAIVLLFFSEKAAVSFLAGTLVMFFNLVVLARVWPRILAKKQFALSIGVIVFKFAILAWIMSEVASSDTLHIGWFAGGLSVIVLSALATALKLSREATPS